MATAEKVVGSGKPAPGSTDLYYYEKIYPKKITGTFRTIKTWTNVVLMAIFFIGPWLRWDRGAGAPDQAIFIDMEGRKAYFFFIEIWPQEVYYLTGLLVIAAIVLFFATALAGRVWCGFACFQTVFTDIFVAIERIIEGDRNQRLKLDTGPMTHQKFTKKLAKNAAWLAISFLVGLGFVLYFFPAPIEAIGQILTFQTSMMPWVTIAVVGGGCYVMAGYAREQVCIYMCPYSRFQSAMLDEDSMIVSYEAWRGEPRVKPKGKVPAAEGEGDCIDCGLCVQVCPTGVDIRNGNQLACIGCGLCIDACNQIMTRFDRPGDLISYDSITNQNARAEGKTSRVRLMRPRTYVYTGILALVCVIMATSLFTRSRLEVNIIHERSPLFVQLSDGQIRNGYTFKVLNMENVDNTFTLTTRGVDGATMDVLGYTDSDAALASLPVERDTVGTFRIYVSAPRSSLDGRSTDLEFVLSNDATGETVEHETLFAGPRP